MHDLRFPELFPIRDWSHLAEQVQGNQACREAASRYRQNLYITHAIGMIPGYAFMNGELWRSAVLHGMKAAGKEDPDHPDVLPQATKYFDDEDTKLDGAKALKQFREGTKSAANIASIAGRHLSHGALHVLLQSIIVQAWTAFEILAGDLTNGVCRLNPQSFSGGRLPKKGFNVKRMESLYDSFRIAFPDEPDIKSKIEDPAIKALGLLRHLIAHKNGIVDQKHIEQCGQSPLVDSFSSFNENEKVLLTGRFVRDLVDPVTVLAYDLIQLVDRWLSIHIP